MASPSASRRLISDIAARPRYLVSLVFIVILQGCRPPQGVDERQWPQLVLEPTDRILILAPHPDDEVIGCGGIIQEAVAKHLPLRIVFLTYGDNNQWSFLLYRWHPVILPKAIRKMGLVRYHEALAASVVLGVPTEQLTFLGYPDFGTLQIWTSHWGDRNPFRSLLTRVTAVPYDNALRFGAPYKGEEVLRDLTTVIREFRPTKIFVSHPADHMPDHRALYLFTRVALWDVEKEMRPTLYPYLVHFVRWPTPRGYQPADWLVPPSTLLSQWPWIVHWLTPSQVQRNYQAIKAHRSQYRYSAAYLLSFIRPNELFGDAPPITFSSTASTALERKGLINQAPEELTEEERATFIGVEVRSVQLEDRELIYSIECSRPLAKAVEASVYLFGYRADRPFAQMPKLHVKIGALSHEVFDQDRLLPNKAVTLSRGLRQITLRVSLETLGEPQRILTSARTYLGELPLDWVSWRVLELPSP